MNNDAWHAVVVIDSLDQHESKFLAIIYFDQKKILLLLKICNYFFKGYNSLFTDDSRHNGQKVSVSKCPRSNR